MLEADIKILHLFQFNVCIRFSSRFVQSTTRVKLGNFLTSDKSTLTTCPRRKGAPFILQAQWVFLILLMKNVTKKTSAMGGFNRLQRQRIEMFLSKVSSTSKRGLEEEVSFRATKSF